MMTFFQCVNKKKENMSSGCSRENSLLEGRPSLAAGGTMGLSKDTLPSMREFITP